MIKPQTLKGFRDFLPSEARKRQYVIETLSKVFESYGFEPLETPALEYEEVLLGKYGEEGDKLMYRFEDLGKRRVALRYDQTVPLARVVAQYQNELPLPFKRYQISPVWRAENPQRGRFREFVQCDIDTVGSSSLLADAEIIYCSITVVRELGFKNIMMRINDRSVFDQQEFTTAQVAVIDKRKKIEDEEVIEELKALGRKMSLEDLKRLENANKTKLLKNLSSYLSLFGLKENEDFRFDGTLARGLDYYTSTIFELEQVEKIGEDFNKESDRSVTIFKTLSLGGGGRYDNLIGIFADKQIPAVGFSFGFDRLVEAMEELSLFPDDLITTKVLVTIFSPELKEKSIEVSSRLRSDNINCELYLNENAKMEKQLKYADQKGIPYVVIIGPDEAKNNTVTVKNLKTREQKTVSLDQLLNEIV